KEVRGHMERGRQWRKPVEAVFGDEAGIIGGTAGRYGNAVDGAEIEGQRLRQFDPARREVDVVGERVTDHLGLLVDFLRHEMAVITLIEQERRGVGANYRSGHRPAGSIL